MSDQINVTVHQTEGSDETAKFAFKNVGEIKAKFVAALATNGSLHCLVDVINPIDFSETFHYTHMIRLHNLIREAGLDDKKKLIPTEFHKFQRGGGKVEGYEEADIKPSARFDSSFLRMDRFGGSHTPEDPEEQKAILDAMESWMGEIVARVRGAL